VNYDKVDPVSAIIHFRRRVDKIALRSWYCSSF